MEKLADKYMNIDFGTKLIFFENYCIAESFRKNFFRVLILITQRFSIFTHLMSIRYDIEGILDVNFKKSRVVRGVQVLGMVWF